MSGHSDWPPSAEALLPLLGLSPAAEVVPDPSTLLGAGRDRDEVDTLVARTTWLIADRERGVVVRSADRVIQVAAVAAGSRFTPFARVHWADLPHELEAAASVVAPLCRSAEQLVAVRADRG